MDSELYQKILEEDFLETLSYYKIKKDNITFQHDNDPKHTSKCIKTWLKKNKIKVLYWPPQSPDLNPIEHLWSEAKRRLYKLPKATSKEDLWKKLQEIWNNIKSEDCIKLIDSMPERIRDVMKVKGSYTRW
jgi:transposase